MRRLILAFIVAAILIVLPAGLAFYYLTPAVETAVATKGQAVQAIYATGVVEPVHWARIGPLSTGRLVAMEAEEGQKVAAGQVLARLDDREAKARAAELTARENYLAEQVRRYSRLRETGAASQQAFDQAKAELDQTQAALEGARKRLADMTLRSPLSGIVLRKDGEPGETVREGQILYWVGETQPLWITVDIDEDDIPLVRVGQKALIRVDAFPGETIHGEVAEITPKGDPVARVYRARVRLPGSGRLHIGMTAEVNIVAREVADAVLVPATAVNDGRVFVLAEDRVGERQVVTGIAGAARIEILSGVQPGEIVVVNPPPRLSDGQRVRPRSAAAAR